VCAVRPMNLWTDSRCEACWPGSPASASPDEMLSKRSWRASRKKVKKLVLGSLEELPISGLRYVLPLSPPKGKNQQPFRFQYRAVLPEDNLWEGDRCASVLDASRATLDLDPSVTPPIIEPAMTPKQGHISMQVSSGLLSSNLDSDEITCFALILRQVPLDLPGTWRIAVEVSLTPAKNYYDNYTEAYDVNDLSLRPGSGYVLKEHFFARHIWLVTPCNANTPGECENL
jgi:hypothetical protein